MDKRDLPGDEDDKAGYNRAARISELLANLTATFTTHMMDNEFSSSLESARAILNVISGKVPGKFIKKADLYVYRIESMLPLAEQTYRSEGAVFYTNFKLRIKIKRMLEILIRYLEGLQNKYGYGMYSADDPKRAIYK